jgi:hypothetical protein
LKRSSGLAGLKDSKGVLVPAPCESIPASISLNLNVGRNTRAIGTYQIPDEILRQGQQAIFDWLFILSVANSYIYSSGPR